MRSRARRLLLTFIALFAALVMVLPAGAVAAGRLLSTPERVERVEAKRVAACDVDAHRAAMPLSRLASSPIVEEEDDHVEAAAIGGSPVAVATIAGVRELPRAHQRGHWTDLDTRLRPPRA